VKQSGWAIQYIPNPDKEVQLEAVKQDGLAIRFITNPDKDVQLAAVRQDTNAIKFIFNPDKEVIVCCLLSIPGVAQLLQDLSYDLKWKREK